MTGQGQRGRDNWPRRHMHSLTRSLPSERDSDMNTCMELDRVSSVSKSQTQRGFLQQGCCASAVHHLVDSLTLARYPFLRYISGHHSYEVLALSIPVKLSLLFTRHKLAANCLLSLRTDRSNRTFNVVNMPLLTLPPEILDQVRARKPKSFSRIERN